MAAAHELAILGAPTNLGLVPYADGTPRRVHETPAVLRALGIKEAVGAIDLGDVPAAAFRDRAHVPKTIRNEDLILDHTRRLAARIADALARGYFPVVLGGECSILLAGLFGASARGRVGLAYVDAHADFVVPATTTSGQASAMDLALATGRGETPLARLKPDGPLVREEDVALLGRKDDVDDAAYGARGPSSTRILDLKWAEIARVGVPATAARAIERLASPETAGFWIHVDADVLRPDLMPAVDDPQPGGLDGDELVALLGPLVAHRKALGLQATIYDPGLDPDRRYGRFWADVLARALTA